MVDVFPKEKVYGNFWHRLINSSWYFWVLICWYFIVPLFSLSQRNKLVNTNIASNLSHNTKSQTTSQNYCFKLFINSSLLSTPDTNRFTVRTAFSHSEMYLSRDHKKFLSILNETAYSMALRTSCC